MNLGSRYSQHSFAQIPNVNIARSNFDRSFAAKDTMNFDYLYPFFVDEILPGDTCNLNVKTFARLATQVVPFMDNAYLDFFFFFVPNRLVWDNWERFNGAQDDPEASVDYLVPQIVYGSGIAVAPGSYHDHMGIPTAATGLSFNSLPSRAIALIWNDWFRDQNLQSKYAFPKGDGPDNVTMTPAAWMGPFKRAKKHDYFTSALPWPQKGDAVAMGLDGSSFIKRVANAANPIGWVKGGTNTPASTGSPTAFFSSGGYTIQDDAGGNGINIDPRNSLYTDGDGLTISINEFRQAMMMQSLLELDARGGTRYTEILRAHFGVVSPDARLQRPEFLSGGTVPLNQHPIAQSSGTLDDSTPQGNLASFATAAELGNKIGFTKSFVEHGFVIGLVQARADITYQYGLNRMWSRRTRWDYFWPKFQELGEQTILNKELYANGTAVGSVDNGVFGYQERYAEYRYRPSEIRGEFRSNYAQTLDVWHLAEEHAPLPAQMPQLDENFIESFTPIERNLAVSNYPALKMDYWFDYKHARPMMTYGVPATLGRF